MITSGDSTTTARVYSKGLSLFMISELDHDAFSLNNLDEYLSSDDKGMADG